MKRLGPRVVKIGGSLFQLPDLAARLRGWLARQSPAAHLLVAGGGEGADLLRRLDSRFSLGELASHEACLHLLEANAVVCAALLPEARLTGSCSRIRRALRRRREGVWIARPRKLLRELARREGGDIPPCWDAASDTIAARFAQAFGARELVLLKSADPPAAGDLAAWAAAGYVDPGLPQFARNLPLRCENLRSPRGEDSRSPRGENSPEAPGAEHAGDELNRAGR